MKKTVDDFFEELYDDQFEENEEKMLEFIQLHPDQDSMDLLLEYLDEIDYGSLSAINCLFLYFSEFLQKEGRYEEIKKNAQRIFPDEKFECDDYDYDDEM